MRNTFDENKNKGLTVSMEKSLSKFRSVGLYRPIHTSDLQNGGLLE